MHVPGMILLIACYLHLHFFHFIFNFSIISVILLKREITFGELSSKNYIIDVECSLLATASFGISLPTFSRK